MLATATASQIHAINSDEGLLGSLGKSTGSASASYLYGSRIAKARSQVESDRTLVHELTADRKQLAKTLDSLVKNGIQDKGTPTAR